MNGRMAKIIDKLFINIFYHKKETFKYLKHPSKGGVLNKSYFVFNQDIIFLYVPGPVCPSAVSP